MRTGSTVVPMVRYRDVPAAIAWLQRAFGFVPGRVARAEDGSISYAQMRFGSGMIIVGPVDEGALGKLMVQPADVGGVETQVCYLVVQRAKAQYARAKAAGAIVIDLDEEDNGGGRGFSCRDPEGHIWTFGSYDPWAYEAQPQEDDEPARPAFRWRRAAVLCAAALLALCVYLYDPARQAVSELGASALVRLGAAGDPVLVMSAQPDQPADARPSVRGTDMAAAHPPQADPPPLEDLRDELAEETRLREVAEQAAAEARRQLEELNAAREQAALAAARTREDLEQAQAAKAAAELAAREAREQLEQVRAARTAAERARIARARALRDLRARRIAQRAAALQRATEAQFPPRAWY
jgi:uncharacterized glyoxalase superfamily protein PhnB